PMMYSSTNNYFTRTTTITCEPHVTMVIIRTPLMFAYRKCLVTSEILVQHVQGQCRFCRLYQRDQEKTSLGSPRKKICFDYFVHTLSITFLADCLGCQPGDEPGSEQSDHYSN